MPTKEGHNGCDEYRGLSRRQFIVDTGALAMAAAAPSWLPKITYAREFCSARDVIISVYLRGGADGLALCAPFGEPAYYAARSSTAIPPPGSANGATNLNGFFGLPPAMYPLYEAYQAGHLCFVHATGSPDFTRSHFDAQRFMEIGKPGDNGLTTGWLGRHLLSVPPAAPNPLLRAAGIGYGLQMTLRGSPQALSIPRLDTFDLEGLKATETQRRQWLADAYQEVYKDEKKLRTAANTTQTTIDLLKTIDFPGYAPSGGAVYPIGEFGYSLKCTAALMRADVGVEAVHIDIANWDTHAAQDPIAGTMALLMAELAQGLAAMHRDLFTANYTNFTVIVMSEFGRVVRENASAGTDHGHGGVMMLMGGRIAGGQVITQWPGLNQSQLHDGQDLKVTIDFRDILSEIVDKRLSNSAGLGYIFPGYSATYRGVTLP